MVTKCHQDKSPSKLEKKTQETTLDLALNKALATETISQDNTVLAGYGDLTDGMVWVG